ncbi:rho GTPase-activating protein 1-like [Pimephales promelas]|nr:rho GTPase-activating protein 1-like [Pimephales promelas]
MRVNGVVSVCVETQKTVFGVPLIGLRKSGQMRQGLPLVLMHIVEFVEKHGLCESGLFRVGGEVKLCHELRKSFDQGSFPDLDSENIPTTASLFKLFLRELPGGLIPDSHRTRLLKVFKDSKEEEMDQALRMILNHLPEEHFNVLSYLLHFLSRVAAESHLNQMTSKNVSIVFGPTIFHVPLGPTVIQEQGLCNDLTEHLLNNLQHLLPNMYPHASTGITAVSLFCVISLCFK